MSFNTFTQKVEAVDTSDSRIRATSKPLQELLAVPSKNHASNDSAKYSPDGDDGWNDAPFDRDPFRTNPLYKDYNDYNDAWARDPEDKARCVTVCREACDGAADAADVVCWGLGAIGAGISGPVGLGVAGSCLAATKLGKWGCFSRCERQCR